MPENTVPVTEEQSKIPPSEKDTKQKILWIVFAVAILILIGLGAYYFLSKTPKTVDQGADQQDDTQEDGEDTEAQELVWLDFSDDLTGITFKYPDGAVITGGVQEEEDICKGTTDCFEFTIAYEGLELKFTGVTGIGGEPTSPGRSYIVISGHQHSGLARNAYLPEGVEKITGGYFEFDRGPLIDVSAIWISFTVPPVDFDKLIEIADAIAVSYYGVSLNDIYEYGRFYLSGARTIIKVDENGQEETVFYAGSYEQNEKLDFFVASDDFNYLAISTRIGQGPEEYLYIYDVGNDSLIEIDGENHWEKIGDYPFWISEHEVLCFSLEKVYKYDMQALTRTEITTDEYDSYLEE